MNLPLVHRSQPIAAALTQHELELLSLLAAGQSFRQMAVLQGVAVSALKGGVQQLYARLGVTNRRQALACARSLGLLPAAQAPPLPTGTVTFLSTDIVGSTPLWEQSPEAMAEALRIHNAALRGAIEAHGGIVFKIVGDEFQAVFPLVSQAVLAAVEGQRALQAAPWNQLGPLAVRMGLHSGDAALDPTGDEYAVSHTKNRVARIRSAAHGGQILLSAAAAELANHQPAPGFHLKNLGEHALKGMALPERLYQVCAPGLVHEFPPLASELAHRHNLPRQLTSLVGRQAEIGEIKGLLQEASLVTLTGSGGVGKTRLAIQTAQEAAGDFRDGAWLVELAPVADPGLIFKTVAAVFNLREDPARSIEDALTDYLCPKQLLLVLDNCEHLILACARLADHLLASCPQLKLLASSRESLGISGEVAYRVPSLPYPETGALRDSAALQHYPAVSLFIERAKSALPGFKLSEHNLGAITRICQRLDGIPLAIELAAARMNILTTEQLAARLDDTFRLLVGGSRTALPRQQTLRATIDWSYDLLNEQERSLLRRMSVFAGGSALEAVEAVCSGDGIAREEILELLISLANKSIVQVERVQGLETRYRLLETVRQYAREKLFDARQSALLRDQHLDYFLALCERAEPQLRSAGRLEWNRRLTQDLDNLRAALEWAYRGPETAGSGLRMVTAIGFRFLTPYGYLSEAIEWVQKGLALLQGQHTEPLLEASAYNLLAEIYENLRDYPAVLHWTQQSLRLLRETGNSEAVEMTWALWEYAIAMQTIHSDKRQAVEALDESIAIARRLGAAGTWYLGMSLYVRSMFGFDDHGSNTQRVQECRQAFIDSGDRWSAMIALQQLGAMAEDRGELDAALQYHQEGAVLAEEISDRPGLSYLLTHLGRLQRMKNNFQRAIQYHIDYLRLWFTMGNQQALKEGFALLALDWIFLAGSQAGAAQAEAYRRAIRLAAMAEKQRSLPYSLMWELEVLKQAIETCRREWGEAEFQRVWAQGEGMTLDESIAFAYVLPGSNVPLVS